MYAGVVLAWAYIAHGEMNPTCEMTCEMNKSVGT